MVRREGLEPSQPSFVDSAPDPQAGVVASPRGLEPRIRPSEGPSQRPLAGKFGRGGRIRTDIHSCIRRAPSPVEPRPINIPALLVPEV